MESGEQDRPSNSEAPAEPLGAVEAPPPYVPNLPATPDMPDATATLDMPTAALAQADEEQSEESAPQRLGRDDSLDLIARLKATIATVAIIALGLFAGLAATHVTGVTSRENATQSNAPGTTATPASNVNSTDDNGGFFGQGSNGGFGVGLPGSQGPAAGSSVS